MPPVAQPTAPVTSAPMSLVSSPAAPAPTGPAHHPQHFVPPTARERRAQAIHRMQIGLFGLAGMLLLVGLANIILDRATLSERSPGSPRDLASAPASPKSTGPAQDPLADMGVVPELPVGETKAPDAAPGRTPR